MLKFRQIDGLRAWLAWIVVLTHIIHLLGVELQKGYLKVVLSAGDIAVCVFIIISGFVITNLLIEKHESYHQYLARRLLRIYPVYLICLVLGVISSQLFFEALSQTPWGSLTPPTDRLAAQMQSLHTGHGYLAHMFAHLSLLHGAIPNNLLYESQYMFLSPAWSLSLEWQFYLIAPFIIFLTRNRVGKIGAALAVVVGVIGFKIGLFGVFILPSILPGAGLYFAVGIVTRLMWNKLPSLMAYPFASIILLSGLCLYSWLLIPFAFWVAFVCYLLLQSTVDPLSAKFKFAADNLFGSKTATYWGHRSYSTYLIHVPIIQTVMYLCVAFGGLGYWKTLAVVSSSAPVLTAILSVILYRQVEKPVIEYGKSLFPRNDAG